MKLTTALLFSSMILFSKASAEPLKVGDQAPVVSALTDTGTTLNLGEVYQANRYTVVWFYPRALTGLHRAGLLVARCQCGTHAIRRGRDRREHRLHRETKEFKAVNHFPFPLLADTDKLVVKAFGQSVMMMASRECYVIKGGKVVYKDTGVTGRQAANVLAFLASDKN